MNKLVFAPYVSYLKREEIVAALLERNHTARVEVNDVKTIFTLVTDASMEDLDAAVAGITGLRDSTAKILIYGSRDQTRAGVELPTCVDIHNVPVWRLQKLLSYVPDYIATKQELIKQLHASNG